MIKTEIRGKLDFPKEFITQNDLVEIADKIIIPDIQKGIHARVAIDGGRLPKNEPATIARKGDDRPLIETGTLLGSLLAQEKGKYRVMVTLGPERKEIGKYLQVDGIKTKHGLKFYKFFGISKDAEIKIINFALDLIRKATKRGR